jgi:hypothetical protein
MPNQYTKAEEEGREKPKGQNAYTTGKRDKMDAAQKAKIRAAFAADKLESYMKGEIELTPAQVSAAKILMDKGMPSLQAVEQTQVNEFEQMSEEEILGLVNALITSNPGLIAKLGIGLRPVEAPQQEGNSVAREQQKAG